MIQTATFSVLTACAESGIVLGWTDYCDKPLFLYPYLVEMTD